MILAPSLRGGEKERTPINREGEKRGGGGPTLKTKG